MDFKQVLLKERDAILKRLEHIDQILSTYDSDEAIPLNKKNENDDSFPVNKSRFDQVIYILEKENRFLHNNEIADFILPYWEGKDIKWVRRRISALLSLIKRETNGAITNIKVNNSLKNTFWGSAKWIDDILGDVPLPEHMYDKSLVEAPKKKSIDF